MKARIMLDLETLGKRPGSVIVAIGAVEFGGGEILSRFYKRIDVESCIAAGLTMDCSTVMWWLQQDDAARMEITKPGEPLLEVLEMFCLWLGCDDAEIWGNGAAFDNVLLAAAYEHAGMELPWKYSNDRCYRTMKNMHPEIQMARSGTHHNALDDAESQALHLMAILEPSSKTNAFLDGMNKEDAAFCQSVLAITRKDELESDYIDDVVLGTFLRDKFRRVADAIEANGNTFKRKRIPSLKEGEQI